MKTITLQQVLNKNYEWFVLEKHPRSTDPSNKMCAYRGDNGAKCAIGCVLPDSLYEPVMDEVGYTSCYHLGMENDIHTVLYRRPDIREFFGDIPEDTLQSLQQIHDNFCRHDNLHRRAFSFDVYMDEKLREFAIENKLNYPN